MASKNETIAGILRKMRENKGIPVPFAPMNAVWVDDFKAYADCIEAAHERELGATCEKSSRVGDAEMCKRDNDKPMTLDEAIAHAEEAVNDTPCGREHKQLVDWLKKLREIKIGNAARMREALKQIYDYAWAHGVWEIEAMAKAALAEPQRNCDRYPTFAAALDAWRDIDPREAGTFNDWLFAEAEGGAE